MSTFVAHTTSGRRDTDTAARIRAQQRVIDTGGLDGAQAARPARVEASSSSPIRRAGRYVDLGMDNAMWRAGVEELRRQVAAGEPIPVQHSWRDLKR